LLEIIYQKKIVEYFTIFQTPTKLFYSENGVKAVENLIAFIGFGEAAFHIGNGLKGEGLNNMVAYDKMQNDEVKGSIIRKRAEEAGIKLVETLEEAYTSAKYVLSLTSSKVAYEVAESVIPNLLPGQVFVDMNSAAPMLKEKIGSIPHKEGGIVLDGAVMNTVPGRGHKVPIFLSGEGAKVFQEELSKYGMNLTDLNAPIGAASAIKMFRSVFMKGLPQLLLESMVPAAKFGALDALVESLNESIGGKTVQDLANNLLGRTILHAERRAKEMRDVVLTLEEMDLDASMSRSAAEKLEQIALRGLPAKVGPKGDLSYSEVIELLLREGVTESECSGV